METAGLPGIGPDDIIVLSVTRVQNAGITEATEKY